MNTIREMMWTQYIHRSLTKLKNDKDI